MEGAWAEGVLSLRSVGKYGIMPNMTRKLIVAAVLFAALATAVAWLWLLYRDGGVTHRDLAELIAYEGEATRTKVDERCDALDAKLDRIEAKLDMLIQLATPRLPDGMTPVD